MIKVALIRGAYLNNFEGQSYIFDKKKIQITGISSNYPIHDTLPFPVIKLPSLSDWIKLGGLGGLGIFGRLGKYLLNRILGDSQILFGLEKYIDQFDIFHTADPHYYYSYQLARLRKDKKIKHLITTSWETIPHNNESVARKKYIKQFTQRYTDLFICYTERAKDCLIAEGIDEDKIKVVRLGVDLGKFSIYNLQFSKRKTVTILFVGRLVEEKGIMEFYEAYKQIFNFQFSIFNENIKLKIIGNGYLKSKLLKMIKKDGLENNVNIETKSYEKMPEIYRESDIFVLPSKKTETWEEQYGMVLVEAMASGLSIVAYKTGAIPEIVDGAAITVNEGNVKELSCELLKLIKNENLREKIGKIGRSRAEKYFDSKKTAEELEKIYITICS